MNDREIIAFLLKAINEQNKTIYAIRRDTAITESSMRKIMGGSGATMATLAKLADYLGYDFTLVKKS